VAGGGALATPQRNGSPRYNVWMAREETDREDILREATALVERVELELPDRAESVVIGFRKNGAASFFFAADPVYQFNSSGELRRAYVAGQVIKADRGVLAALTKERTENEVRFLRRDLTAAETERLLADLYQRLHLIQSSLCDQSFTHLGQFPERSDILGRISNWLAALPLPIKIARSPHVR